MKKKLKECICLFRVKSANTRPLHKMDMQSHSADQSSMDSQSAVVDDRFTHLSAFALSGMDGNVRWHHVAGDFEQTHAKVYMSAVANETVWLSSTLYID